METEIGTQIAKLKEDFEELSRRGDGMRDGKAELRAEFESLAGEWSTLLDAWKGAFKGLSALRDFELVHKKHKELRSLFELEGISFKKREEGGKELSRLRREFKQVHLVKLDCKSYVPQVAAVRSAEELWESNRQHAVDGPARQYVNLCYSIAEKSRELLRTAQALVKRASDLTEERGGDLSQLIDPAAKWTKECGRLNKGFEAWTKAWKDRDKSLIELDEDFHLFRRSLEALPECK